MNNNGKVLTVFLIVIAVLLVSLTVISVFFYFKEAELRHAAQSRAEQLDMSMAKLQEDIREANKQKYVLEEKLKEAEGKIEDLLEDLDLAQGVRDEIKNENRQIRESLEKESKAKEDLRAEYQKKMDVADEKLASLQEKLDVTINRNKELEQRRQELENQIQGYKDRFGALELSASSGQKQSGVSNTNDAANPTNTNIDLEKIVITPDGEPKGTVISVDKAADFVIVSLGDQHGVKKDMLLSVYRGQTYLGDIIVTRVLSDMSAADFVPPLKSQEVSNDDVVVIKK